MGIQVGDLYVILGLKDEGLTKGLAAQQKSLQTFGKTAVVVGGAIVASFGLAIKQWADAGEQINIMSAKTGLGTVALSEMKYAADLSGSSLESVGTASKFLSRNLIEAKLGSDTAVAAFGRIGLSLSDIKDLNPEDLFFKVGEAIGGIEDPALKSKVAMDLFGRSGVDMLPMLTSDLSDVRKEAHTLGVVFDKEAAVAAKNFNDSLTKLTASANGLKYEIVEGVVPALAPMIDNMTSIVKLFSTWAKQNPDLVSTLSQMTISFGGISLAMGGTILLLPKLMSGYKALIAMATAWQISSSGIAGGRGVSPGLLTGISTAGLLAGGAMIGYGVNTAVGNAQAQDDYAAEKVRYMQLSVQAEKYNKGEANSLQELVNEYKNVSPAAAQMAEQLDSINAGLRESIQLQRDASFEQYYQGQLALCRAFEDQRILLKKLTDETLALNAARGWEGDISPIQQTINASPPGDYWYNQRQLQNQPPPSGANGEFADYYGGGGAPTVQVNVTLDGQQIAKSVSTTVGKGTMERSQLGGS